MSVLLVHCIQAIILVYTSVYSASSKLHLRQVDRVLTYSKVSGHPQMQVWLILYQPNVDPTTVNTDVLAYLCQTNGQH